jgi:hypothetical protein
MNPSPTRYRKKPVVIDAVRNDGDWPSIVAWLEATTSRIAGASIARLADGSINIQTTEGVMRCDVGDWLLKGVAGEFYPCKSDIFAETYEAVDVA